ncbi:MAG: 23S rRNA (adenine(2503)-C(2))-methyltransferase RlmN [Clostridia bacterium]|nr:23S rRNA (adenine(2503)-C(2))-methyltransferase RlmN [Clostridia bacterium]
MHREEVRAWMQQRGLPAFRGDQVFSWIHRGRDFDEMTNLPLSMRETLKSSAVAQPVKISDSFHSRVDDTVKFLYEMRDGNCVEGVLMHYHHGYSLCISTQVGCNMGCAFCASTLEGCVRSLSAGEMLGEVLCANRYLEEKGEKVHNLVLMGAGEPLDNYDEVMRFLRLLREKGGIELSLRSVSLSTCGLVDRIRRLADEDLPVTLSLSLHAPNDEVRRKIMPIAKRWSMKEALDACRYYIEKTGRRVIVEYALIDGVNASVEQAEELAGKLRNMQVHVNLIPLNEVKERQLKGVSERQVRAFLERLEACHISATRRREMGDDIAGACGQLRRSVILSRGAEAGTSA